MVYLTGRKGVQMDVRQPVGADHHGALLGVEGIHHLLQGIRTRIDIIAVQLHQEPAALGMMGCHIPASPYPYVTTGGN